MTIASDYVAKINDLELGDDPRDEIDDYGAGHDADQVEKEVVEEHRWYNIVRHVYRCTDGSHFAVSMELPASEIQQGQDPSFKPVAELVTPREVTVTKYFAVAQDVAR